MYDNEAIRNSQIIRIGIEMTRNDNKQTTNELNVER